jgi:hypothetical protein
MISILSAIKSKLIWQKDNYYQGDTIYIETKVLNKLKEQEKNTLNFCYDLTTIFGLKIFELTPIKKVSFSKYDIFLADYFFEKDLNYLAICLDIPKRYLE